MRRIVLTFGLIAGGLLSLMLVVSMALIDRIGMETGQTIGYTTMVLAFLFVFFGVRAYRDNVSGGAIGFGRAFAIGLLITAVASACYVLTWQVIYHWMIPDFAERYAAQMLESARASGATAEQLAAQSREMERFQALYANPLFNIAITFLEPLPVGVVMSLVSAGILRRRERSRDAVPVRSASPAL
jgi:hypothetical protein